MTPNFPITGVSTQGTKFLGQTPTLFSSRFSGFSICNPIYQENTMLLATRHAIYSAAVSTEETATFMLLPVWNKDMITNPYASLCRKYPHMCKFFGTIPSNQLQYAKVPFWNNIQIPLSKHPWGLKVIAIWNMEHQGQGLPQCSQQRLAKRTCQRNP
jgi:hypothetical protein